MPTFSGWPTRHEGRPLKRLPLTHREERFSLGFPGRIAKFTDGSRMVIVRWVTKETRKLHPASDCFKGIGYAVQPLPIHIDAQGTRWGCFKGTRDANNILVFERIFEDAGAGWTDVSAWYWAAVLRQTHGPWWAVTVVESQSVHGETVCDHSVSRNRIEELTTTPDCIKIPEARKN